MSLECNCLFNLVRNSFASDPSILLTPKPSPRSLEDAGALSRRETGPLPPAVPAQAFPRLQATPGGLAFYDLLLTSRVSPPQLRASQRASFVFSIANVNALEAEEETPGATKG